MKELHEIKLIVIDYLQLIYITQEYNHIRENHADITEISRILKTLARELNVPILCTSQLSHKTEFRNLKRTEDLEENADVVMYLLQKEDYDPDNKPSLAELHVQKNRHGRVGSIDMAYLKELAQFIPPY